MMAFKSLLAATDFSDDARNAVERAARIAAEHQAALALLHVINGTSLAALRELFRQSVEVEARLIAESLQMLEHIAADLPQSGGPPITTQVKIGAVLAEIVAAADQTDVLVIGARGMNPFRDLLLGTTAERLLGKCMPPALVVKLAPEGPYRRVLAPVDFSSCSTAVVETALRIAPQADIHVCHAFDVPVEGKLWLADVAEEQIHQYRIQARQRAKAELFRLVARFSNDQTRTLATIAELGDTIRVILDQAEEIDADLIVIGKHGGSTVGEFILGGVTRHILSQAKCDVLVVGEKCAE